MGIVPSVALAPRELRSSSGAYDLARAPMPLRRKGTLGTCPPVPGEWSLASQVLARRRWSAWVVVGEARVRRGCGCQISELACFGQLGVQSLPSLALRSRSRPE